MDPNRQHVECYDTLQQFIRGGDKVVGGEGGTDDDTLDQSGLGLGVKVTFTGDEAGSVTDGTNTLTFSEIENLVLTDQGDIVDATADTSGLNIGAGGGNDSIAGGTGSDMLSGGIGNDTISAGTGYSSNVVYGGDGDDSILGNGEDGSDTIYGGDGNDWIDAGNQSDSVEGGSGADTIVSDWGYNTLDGGSGDDSIAGGGHLDTIIGGDGADTIYGDFAPTDHYHGTYGGSDTIDGGDGDASIVAGLGSDSVYGGTGSDTISRGAGNDTINAYDGDDNVDGGSGNDSLSGGAGDDVFSYSVGDGLDTIADFNAGNSGALGDGDTANNDFIDLSGLYDAIADLREGFEDDGILSQSNITSNGGSVDYSGNSQFASGEGILFQGLSSSNLTTDNAGVVCYSAGTRIRTPFGHIPIEHLRPGDLVTTRDNGPKPIAWIGSRTLSHAELRRNSKLLPIEIGADFIGADRPLVVSPQHGLVLDLDGDETLIRATHLAHLKGGSACVKRGCRRITYLHLMFEAHEIVFAENALSESLFLGPHAMDALTAEKRREVAAIFPELLTRTAEAAYGGRSRALSRFRDLPRELGDIRAVAHV